MGETIEIEKLKPTGYDLAAWLMAGAALLLILKLRLLPALLSGMLVYELVHVLSWPLRIGKSIGLRARVVVVSLLAIMIVALLSLYGVLSYLSGESRTYHSC